MNSRWVHLAVGLVLAVLGGLLITRPFASLAVVVVLTVAGLVAMGVAELIQHPRPWRWTSRLTVAACLAGAVAILARPGLGIEAIALVVGLVLVGEGLLKLYGAATGARRLEGAETRLSSALSGAAAAVLGVLALAWPDVTVVVMAVVFGVRVCWWGLTLLWGAVWNSPAAVTLPPTRLRRNATVLVSVLALLASLALAGVSSWLHRSAPRVDAFYTAPTGLPDEPGQLLRSEPFTRGLPAGARGWRILYTTTRDEGRPAIASALVVAKRDGSDAPRPVIAWAHGTTGQSRRCAPSLLPDPFEAGAMPALDQVVERDWVLVATDYVGLGTPGPHPYLIGQGQGRSVLDSVRAARQLDALSLQPSTVLWGHSQGGGAALWAGILAPTYAPDTHVIGVAALAPATDLPGLVSSLGTITGGALFASYAIAAYAAVYDDVDFRRYVRPGAQLPLRKMADRCLAEPQTLVSIAKSLAFDKPFFGQDPRTGPLGRRLVENIPSGTIPFPVLLAQGLTDPLVLPAVQSRFVAQRCAGPGNGPLDYRTYPGREHVDLVADDSPLVPDLLTWTAERIAGKPAVSTCPR